MVLPPLPGENLPHPVRQPVFEVAFGGSAGDTALGGLAAAVGEAIGVDLGGGTTDPWQHSVTRLVVETGLAPVADVVEIDLSTDDQAPTVAVGDTGNVSLGYAGGETALIFTGQVEAVRRTVQGTTRITATNGGAALARLRVNQSYEQQKAGDIVRDLAGRAEVDTDTIEDGLDLAFYVVDDRRSAYQQIAALARKSDYLAYFTPEGKLSFAPFTAGQAIQTFAYGEDVLSLQVADAAPVMGAVTTIGEGAAGSQGQDAWSWLVKDPSSVRGSAGEGEAERQLQDASLRSGDAAQSAADGIANAASLTNSTGMVLVAGAPAVIVGSAIEIADAPQDALNDLYLVRRARHRFSKRDGFTTLICFSKTSGGGGGSLGGLL